MKTSASTQFTVLAVISGIVTGITFFTGNLFNYTWGGFSDGEAEMLPEVTIYAMRYGFLVPLICCLASIICIVISKKRSDNLIRLWQLFTLIVVVELLGQALIAWFYVFPSLRITFRMM